VHDHVYDGGITVQARRRLNAGSASRLAPPAGGADLGVGDLVGEQSVGLGGFGGGVAEAAADDLDGDAAVESSVAWAWRSWRLPIVTPAAAQYFFHRLCAAS